MRLLRLSVLLILAIVVIAEPVVHSHPLLPGSGDSSGLSSSTICAICAVGADRAVVSAPVIVAPLIVVEHVATIVMQPVTHDARVPVASRAPPAA